MPAWLFFFFAPVAADVPPTQDYIGVAAAEAAYASLLPDAAPVKPKVPTKNCKTCKGLGKVPSGDGHEWTKCPDCDPTLGQGAAKVYADPPTPPEPPTGKSRR